jgi:hypothetical protein
MRLRALFEQTAVYLAPLLDRSRRLQRFFDRIFADGRWIRLFDEYEGSNFEIIGDLKTYAVIWVTNIPEKQIVRFSKQFFSSLQRFQTIAASEIQFKCGLILDIDCIEETARTGDIDIRRLTKPDLLGRRRTWYYSHMDSTVKRASIRTERDCVFIDI